MNDDGIPYWFAFALFILGFVGGALVASSGESYYWQKRALEAGVGEYYLDSNYEKQFRFKKP